MKHAFYEVINLSEADFENPKNKNRRIRETHGEILLFANTQETTAEELRDILEENPFLKEMDAVAFGEGLPTGECSQAQILSAPMTRFYALSVKRSIFASCGSFHEKLQAGSNWEFLSRCANAGTVFFVECGLDTPAADPSHTESRPDAPDAKTLAYTVLSAQKASPVDPALSHAVDSLVSALSNTSLLQAFLSEMRSFTQNPALFEEYRKETSPILFLCDSDTCYGIPRYLADGLMDAFAAKGIAIRNLTGPEITERLLKEPCRGIIGFQTPFLEHALLRSKNCPRFQFWFDNPVYFQTLFQDRSDSYYVLCQDGGYADYIRKYFGVPHASHFPPGGRLPAYSFEELRCMERDLDLVFLGTYYPEEKPWESPDSDDPSSGLLYTYLLAHPEKPFEEAYLDLCPENSTDTETDLPAQIAAFRPVFRAVTSHFRTQILESILSSGLRIHVYGDSWDRFPDTWAGNLIRHPEAAPEEAMEILCHTKISLNIMTWHKDGMTERIIHSMLCGAVCVSDESRYLRTHYQDGAEVALFSLQETEKLPALIRSLLSDSEKREAMAEKAYVHALREETWEQRVDELLRLL